MQKASAYRKYTVSLLLALSTCYTWGSSLTEIKSRFQQELSLQIITDEKTDHTWPDVTYDLCTDSTEIFNYLSLLYQEYKKYPPGFFEKIRIKKIIVCKNLALRDQYRAAIPDPKKNSVVLSLNGQKGIFTEYYLTYVMHHELHHCTEFSLWKSMIYKWPEWNKLNSKNFKYQKGGSVAYKKENTAVNWLGSTHPHEGFINLYSTTGPEEDRSELMAMLMTEKGNADILTYYHQDE